MNVYTATDENTSMIDSSFQTQQALAVAFAAMRVNGDYIKDTRRFSENKTLFANKDIVRFQLMPQYAPEDFEPVQINENDYDNVEATYQHFKRYALDVLGDKLNDFQTDVYKIVSNDTVNNRKLGLVSYIPKLVEREIITNRITKLLRTEYRNSKHIGQPGDKVTGLVKILHSFPSIKYGGYFITGVIKGDIVNIFKKEDAVVGKTYELTGKVKRHQKAMLFPVEETKLNYVKMKEL